VVEGESSFVSSLHIYCFEILLTPKKLQSHSEAEEGVSVGRFKDRKDAGLQTPTHSETIVSTPATPGHISAYRAAYIKVAQAYGNHQGDIGSGEPKRTSSNKKLDRLTHNGRRDGLAGVAIYSIHGHTKGSTSNRKDLSIPFISTHLASKLIIINPSYPS
jgi:hypothetical protein